LPRRRRGPAADRELLPVRHERVEVVIGWPAGPLRETPRDEGPGAAIGLDEHELPVAPVGGILLQDRLGGRAAPGEGVEDQRAGAGGDPSIRRRSPTGLGIKGYGAAGCEGATVWGPGAVPRLAALQMVGTLIAEGLGRQISACLA
jgi:hypothetical protein